ncbi:hypothetical protein L3X38_042865 [Prunus dulcis]|uniref:RNase H type-1 domain-containing protein n=1 Tax=Prunus dulcis TaxID=3755 RepID=A0AAD4YLY4_PRUDU|nr:hypothetical protein L3X38_042865 [Prunus dulcis]
MVSNNSNASVAVFAIKAPLAAACLTNLIVKSLNLNPGRWIGEGVATGTANSLSALSASFAIGKPALMMEAKAIRVALTAIMDVGVDKVEVETDCLQLIKMLQGKDKIEMTLERLIHDIWFLCKSFSSLEFLFTPW